MSRRGDLYEILQVSPNAEPEVIEAAYRRLARKYHPDGQPGDETTPIMIGLNLAYATLRDPARRAAYDRRRLPADTRTITAASHAAVQRPSSPSPPSRRALPPSGVGLTDWFWDGLGLVAAAVRWAGVGVLTLAVLAWIALAFYGGVGFAWQALARLRWLLAL